MAIPPDQRFFIGVDVGTGSVRAGVFDGMGKMHGAAIRPIQIRKPALAERADASYLATSRPLFRFAGFFDLSGDR
jgi:predicted NBD/HSP70 family sugar kinase